MQRRAYQKGAFEDAEIHVDLVNCNAVQNLRCAKAAETATKSSCTHQVGGVSLAEAILEMSFAKLVIQDFSLLRTWLPASAQTARPETLRWQIHIISLATGAFTSRAKSCHWLGC